MFTVRSCRILLQLHIIECIKARRIPTYHIAVLPGIFNICKNNWIDALIFPKHDYCISVFIQLQYTLPCNNHRNR